jgi:leader peptidase (prepilin peptidase)/N-methyltransferase
VKLAFVLGTFLGYAAVGETVGRGIGVVLAGMFLSFLLGGIVGVAVMLATGGDRKMQVPFGPFLAAGSVLGIFMGEWVVESYLGLM